jgi:hypothetical protein
MYLRDRRTNVTTRMVAHEREEWDSSARRQGGASTRAANHSEGDSSNGFS